MLYLYSLRLVTTMIVIHQKTVTGQVFLRGKMPGFMGKNYGQSIPMAWGKIIHGNHGIGPKIIKIYKNHPRSQIQGASTCAQKYASCDARAPGRILLVFSQWNMTLEIHPPLRTLGSTYKKMWKSRKSPEFLVRKMIYRIHRLRGLDKFAHLVITRG